MKYKCFVYLALILGFCCPDVFSNVSETRSRPNVLLILADDLGYGDLSVPPFVGHGIKTPELEKMAQNGIKFTNFHVAAPICTPSRAAIITGLFPWRLGIYAIYGTGPQANEHLAVVPNMPITFLKAGYHTAHVGKWHLGGLKLSDVNARMKLMNLNDTNCLLPNNVDPGPRQHGFKEFVTMHEGPNSIRLTQLLPRSTLYHEGSQYLIRNEEPYKKTTDILTDRQTNEAIRIINESISAGKNFFIHLWYDAPHGPWEIIKPFDNLYPSKMWGGPSTRNYKYATMVSSMDANIGRLLRALETLGVANNTIVVFLSDNGPEVDAGGTGIYKGRKRSLYEGGIRVPCIIQWNGKVPKNMTIDEFVISTDLFPTFMDAAGISRPQSLRLDGVSFLPFLTGAPGDLRDPGDSRMMMWHKDISGRSSAAWSHGYKLLVSDSKIEGLFDMRERKGDEMIDYQSIGKPQSLPQNNITSLDHTSKTLLAHSAHRKEPAHLYKVKGFLLENLNRFVTHGHKPHAIHKESKHCFPHDIDIVNTFPWNISSSIPIF